MRYIIAPLDLTTEQREIYFLLYSKMDFNTFKTKYTLQQLSDDSNPRLGLTRKKISKIIKDFIEENLLIEMQKGTKGKPTIYEIIKIREQISNECETNKEQIGTNKKQINVENSGVEHCRGTNKEQIGTNRKQIRNKSVTPINDKEKEKEKDIIFTVIEYLNEKAEKKFRKNTRNTIKDINARIKEGFTIEEFKMVIDNKVHDWKGKVTTYPNGDKFIGDNYLRPETLFGNKFESYLNEKPKIEKVDSKPEIKAVPRKEEWGIEEIDN